MQFFEAPMHLWAEKHGYPRPAPSDFEQHNMAQGDETEEIANEFLLETIQPDSACRVEFQKTFKDGNFEARIDGLVFDAEAEVYDLYEVKSSTSVKKEHGYDLTFQTLICEANISVRKAYLVYLISGEFRKHWQGKKFLGTFFRNWKTILSESQITKCLGEV